MGTPVLAFGLTFGLATSTSSYEVNQTVESCITAIQKQKSGELINLEKLNVAGKSREQTPVCFQKNQHFRKKEFFL